MEQHDTEQWALHEVKTPGYWYLYYLIRDGEFRSKADALISQLKMKYPGLPGYDDDWLKIAGAETEDIMLAEDLANEYETAPLHVYRCGTGFYNSMPLNPAFASGKVENGRIIIEFDPNVTQAQYRSYWQVFRLLKKELGLDTRKRLRGAENYELIYAVHKARRAKMKFPDIFNLYKTSSLPSYDGSTSQYSTSKSLEAYFNKYDFTKG
jgi:hypothetical protein